jgi:ribosome-associated translation inhibitor RaiA
MQILVNSDNHIKNADSPTVRSIVGAAVDRFETRITRLEVHLSDTNGPKHGENEKRAVIEARVGGLRPIAVSHEAPTLLEAIEGASNKLERALDHTLGRLEDIPGPTPREGEIASTETMQAVEKGERS